MVTRAAADFKIVRAAARAALGVKACGCGAPAAQNFVLGLGAIFSLGILGLHRPGPAPIHLLDGRGARGAVGRSPPAPVNDARGAAHRLQVVFSRRRLALLLRPRLARAPAASVSVFHAPGGGPLPERIVDVLVGRAAVVAHVSPAAAPPTHHINVDRIGESGGGEGVAGRREFAIRRLVCGHRRILVVQVGVAEAQVHDELPAGAGGGGVGPRRRWRRRREASILGCHCSRRPRGSVDGGRSSRGRRLIQPLTLHLHLPVDLPPVDLLPGLLLLLPLLLPFGMRRRPIPKVLSQLLLLRGRGHLRRCQRRWLRLLRLLLLLLLRGASPRAPLLLPGAAPQTVLGRLVDPIFHAPGHAASHGRERMAVIAGRDFLGAGTLAFAFAPAPVPPPPVVATATATATALTAVPRPAGAAAVTRRGALPAETSRGGGVAAAAVSIGARRGRGTAGGIP
mmetsp:Transcript_51859/g.155627  ORF Transcript_51859/g.155627 Transcript_51859/m.155627 type:complete len:453 (-) Transcript_51859:139-1497(-)